MFSSTKSGRIKISRLLIGGAIVLFLLLSLDQVFYLVENRSREGFISETEPVAGQALFPTNGQIFRYDVRPRTDSIMTYWAEVWRDGRLEPELSQAFYHIPDQERHVDRYLQFAMENGSSGSAHPSWTWAVEEVKTEKNGLFYEGKWLKFSLGQAKISKFGATYSAVPDSMSESLKAVCVPGATSNWVSSWRKIGRWRIEPGKIYTLLEIQCGAKDPVIANAGEGKRVGSLIYLKVRFDPTTVYAGNGRPFVECHPLGSIAENSGKYGL